LATFFQPEHARPQFLLLRDMHLQLRKDIVYSRAGVAPASITANTVPRETFWRVLGTRSAFAGSAVRCRGSAGPDTYPGDPCIFTASRACICPPVLHAYCCAPPEISAHHHGARLKSISLY